MSSPGPTNAIGQLHRRLPPWRVLGAGALIIAVSGSILLSRLAENAPVVLAPPGGVTLYEIHVVAGGESLKAEAIRERYRLPVRGTTPLTPAGLRSIIRNRESRGKDTGSTFVRLHLRQNGGAETIWLWPDR